MRRKGRARVYARTAVCEGSFHKSFRKKRASAKPSASFSSHNAKHVSESISGIVAVFKSSQGSRLAKTWLICHCLFGQPMAHFSLAERGHRLFNLLNRGTVREDLDDMRPQPCGRRLWRRRAIEQIQAAERSLEAAISSQLRGRSKNLQVTWSSQCL